MEGYKSIEAMEYFQRWQYAFIISCIFSLFCWVLPALSSIFVLLTVTVWLFYRQKPLFAWGLLGCCWFFLHAHLATNWSLEHGLIKQPVTVVGVIDEIPSQNQNNIRFNLKLTAINGEPIAFWQQPKVRITWHDAKQILSSGDKIKFTANLKPPHGFSNDGGFSFQKWLLLNGIRATGYVVGSRKFEILSQGDSHRQQIFTKVSKATQSLPYQGLILALTVGEKQQISSSQWQMIKAGGISHLLAISGLHIGIIFLLGTLVAKVVLKCASFLLDRHINAPKTAMLLGLLCAFGYAYLAGFAIPTVRALIMLSLFSIAIYLQKNVSGKTVVINTLFLILLVDPLSILEPGLWLSIVAVITILAVLWWLPLATRNPKYNPMYKVQSYVYSALRVQIALFVFMLPLTMIMFNGFSVAGIAVNLIAVPWVSFTTVPLSLLGALFELLGLPSQWLFELADGTLSLLFSTMEYSDVENGWLTLSAVPWHSWLMLIVFSMSLLLPLSIKCRLVSALLVFPAALSITFSGPQFNLHVLDVGQGLSVAIEKDNKVMVYDLGPTYKSGFNTAEQVVLPLLTYHGHRSVDKLILSHGDSDHAGDWKAFTNNIAIEQIFAPQKLIPTATQCIAQSFDWQSLKVEVFWPLNTSSIPSNSNDSSCVIRVSSHQHSILLTGDISKRVESQLVSRYGETLQSDILVAPHHGSNSSSTKRFIDAVKPQYVIYSTGYLNHYKFPRQEVVDRYTNAGVKQLNTAQTGQITFSLTSPDIELSTARSHQLKHWYYNQ